jgi:hypothetical protein
MSYEVDFNQWGWIYLAPGASTTWWFTWIFDDSHWSRISVCAWNSGPQSASVQIVAEWMTAGTWHVTFKNNGSAGVSFKPTFIETPSRF